MRLHELCLPDKPVDLKYVVTCKETGVTIEQRYKWDGTYLTECGHRNVVTTMMLSDYWQLDPPTLESVCKERGWKFNEVSACVLIDDTTKHLHCHANFPPAKLAKMLDVLEGKE